MGDLLKFKLVKTEVERETPAAIKKLIESVADAANTDCVHSIAVTMISDRGEVISGWQSGSVYELAGAIDALSFEYKMNKIEAR